MTVRISEICEAINEIAPESIAESWDNSGLQIAMTDKPVETVYVCLEITSETVEEAASKKAEMIISHHPLIFKPIRTIDDRTATGKYILDLIESGISVYSAHTSFDSAWGGNNDDLARRIGLINIRALDDGLHKESGGLGRRGEYAPPRTLGQIVEIIKESLQIDRPVGIVGDPEAMIGTVAVSAGSGADIIDDISLQGCELLVTGDTKFRHGQKAAASGIALIDAGHFHTEKIFVENMSRLLSEKFNNRLRIIESSVDRDPFIMI